MEKHVSIISISIILKALEEGKKNEKFAVKGKSFVKQGISAPWIQILTLLVELCTSHWASQRSSKVISKVPFQVLKSMIIYSENCHDSFKRNFSHTFSTLWKTISLLVAIIVPKLLQCPVLDIRLCYLHNANY